MGHPISPRIDGIELILIVAESLVYGIFVKLFARCFVVLMERRRRPDSGNVLLLMTTATLLFVLITAHLVLDFCRAYDAFIYAQDDARRNGTAGMSSNPETLYFADLTNPKNAALGALYQATTAIGDAFMSYRRWIVWSHNFWVIIVPVLLTIAMNVTAGRIVVLLSHSHETIFQTVGGCITAFFVLTFFANILSTALISYKVWRSNHSFGRAGGSSTVKIFYILVHSAALYSFFLIITLATYVAESNVQFIMVAMNNPIIGIIFAMIIVRGSSSSMDHSSNISMTSGGRGTRAQSDAAYSMRPMAIKISTDVEVSHTPASFDNDKKVSHDSDSNITPYTNDPSNAV